MNVLFVSISAMPHLDSHSISIDLIHEMTRQGHSVYVLCALDNNSSERTTLSEECGCKVLRVKIGANKKANIIVKGITTLRMSSFYISAIKKYYSDVKFDLVMYPTPPVTVYKTVKYIKKRDGAKSYLLLKDIFPQNAVDIGMMKKKGIKGVIYKSFRKTEKKLYAISDKIGCMSPANCEYVLKHNPEISPDKVEVCPNSIEFRDMRIDAAERDAMREKYSLPLDKKIFVYGGNLGRPQGIPYLMECLKKAQTVDGAHLLVVGDGTEYKKLEEFFANEKPKNATLMRKLPKEDYDRLVAACDVGLIFLDKRFQIPNFPSRLLAYMQAGLPTISATDVNSDVGTTCVDGGFGWWCESRDPDDFVKIMNEALLADLLAMGERAIAYLKENYTVEGSYEIIKKSIGL